jgi:putative ABC transport system ATP-binding protein
MITMENITKSYEMGTQTVHALRGVDMQLREGEFVAIMGPSGSGKSTLMNIIGCLDIPTGGTYTLDGIDVSQMTDDEQARIRNKRVGFVFQQFNLLPRTAAIKQVALPLMYAGSGRSERFDRAEKALQMVGLGDRIDHRPDELSGGQQQRVAIARALVTEPAIILADEPTGNLDSQSGVEVMEIFKRLHRERGITLILITHDPEVAAMAERTIWIRDGVIVSDESTGDIQAQPAVAAVAYA